MKLGGCVTVDILVGDNIEESSSVTFGGGVVTATVHSGANFEVKYW